MTRVYGLVEIIPFQSASVEDIISQDLDMISWKCAKQVSEKHRTLSIKILIQFYTRAV